MMIWWHNIIDYCMDLDLVCFLTSEKEFNFGNCMVMPLKLVATSNGQDWDILVVGSFISNLSLRSGWFIKESIINNLSIPDFEFWQHSMEVTKIWRIYSCVYLELHTTIWSIVEVHESRKWDQKSRWTKTFRIIMDFTGTSQITQMNHN